MTYNQRKAWGTLPLDSDKITAFWAGLPTRPGPQAPLIIPGGVSKKYNLYFALFTG